MPATIEIFIKDGKINIEVSGVSDASCADITAALEKELGEVENVQHKPEYYVELDDIQNYAYEEEE